MVLYKQISAHLRVVLGLLCALRRAVVCLARLGLRKIKPWPLRNAERHAREAGQRCCSSPAAAAFGGFWMQPSKHANPGNF